MADKRYGDSGRQVQCKVELFSLNAIDILNHTFSAAVYVQLRAKEGSMTVQDMEKLNVEFLNLKATDKDKRNSDATDGFICQHIIVSGDWCTALDLSAFPMDTQKLEVKFEVWDEQDMNAPITPVPFGDSLAKGFLLTDSFRALKDVEEDVKEVADVPTFYFRMVIKRRIGFYVYNYFIPISCMTSLAFTSIGIGIDSTGDRLATVLSLFLTVVAYKMALSDNFPPISTPCLLDVFIMSSFFLMGMITIVLSLGKVYGDKVDKWVMWMLPLWLLFLLICGAKAWHYKYLDRRAMLEDDTVFQTCD